MKHAVTKSRKRKTKRIKDIFGGECSICGYNNCYESLAFHHTDPNLKEHNPSYIVGSWGEERAVKQLEKEKVILVCCNCHGEIHSEDYNFDYEVRPEVITESKCPQCDEVFLHPDKKDRVFCSVDCRSLSQRKVKDRPSKDELNELLNKYSYVKVGKMFGVSDNTIRNWL